jgi:hypothetical protein
MNPFQARWLLQCVESLWAVALVLAWLVLQRWVLPRFGVST